MATIADFFINFLKRPKFTFHPVSKIDLINEIRIENLARKYLSVPASSAWVERMFSFLGHIISLKRRRLGIQFFMVLSMVWFKLNEILY